MKNIPAILASLGLLACAPLAPAAELGDPAAKLEIAEWIKGGPVDLAAAKGKQIVVVEFWATWCPPCRTSIPHLTEMQKKFKDQGVVFVGISDETPATVKKFVKQMGDKMEYGVAIDQDRKTSDGYMKAFKQNGIPHAFIVDKESRIIWHGHPMANLEGTLAQVVAGKYDLGVAKKRDRAETLQREFMERAVEGGNEAILETLGKELVQLDAELGGLEPGQKFNPDEALKLARFQGALREYQMALSSGRTGEAVAALEQKIKTHAPEGFELATFQQHFKLQRVWMNYYRAATGRGNESQLPELAREMEDLKSDNANTLNDIAWTLLTDEKIKERDLKLAMKFAQAAYDACDGKDAAVVDTYARALFDTGKTAEAIRYQKEAIKLSQDDALTTQLKQVLADYERKAEGK